MTPRSVTSLRFAFEIFGRPQRRMDVREGEVEEERLALLFRFDPIEKILPILDEIFSQSLKLNRLLDHLLAAIEKALRANWPVRFKKLQIYKAYLLV